MSHLVTNIPSIPLSFPTPEAAEKSFRARSNLVNWSTASLPTKASPTNKILSGELTATSLASARIKGCWDGNSVSCWRNDKHRWACLVILHPACRIDQDDIKIIISGVSDRFFGDSSRILSVAPFVELNSTLTPSWPIHTKHAQVSNVHTELFHCAAPTRSITLQR